ncbi:MAG: TetR/AcrR family transcriptional regulator [Deltaproteobacteria bacterium]|nr:TetR/AcrR family transcriptional regulator [Deltaproteobacteria bacterium]MBW2596157.1 TetR/AcrR family transcriptional regulator [Deltaproteobacteria bacterium]
MNKEHGQSSVNAPGKRRTQEERSREMRARLIEAALDCLHDYGYHGTSLSRILERAGVSRGAWGHHYSSKKELIAAASEAFFGDAIQKARGAVPDLGKGDDPIAVLLDFIWDNFYQGRNRNVWVELTVAGRTDAELRELLVPAFEHFVSILDENWREYMQATDAADVPVETIMNLSLYIIGGMGLQSIVHDKPQYYKTLREQWTKIISPLVQMKKQEC